MMTRQPAQTLERHEVTVTLPGVLDDGEYKALLARGWVLSEQRSNGREITFTFTRPAGAQPGAWDTRGARSESNE